MAFLDLFEDSYCSKYSVPRSSVISIKDHLFSIELSFLHKKCNCLPCYYHTIQVRIQIYEHTINFTSWLSRDLGAVVIVSHWQLWNLNVEQLDKQPENHSMMIV